MSLGESVKSLHKSHNSLNLQWQAENGWLNSELLLFWAGVGLINKFITIFHSIRHTKNLEGKLRKKYSIDLQTIRCGRILYSILREKSASFGLENKVVLYSKHDNVHVCTHVNEQGNIQCLLNPIQELWYLISSLH
jgi:hypothetical protein